MTRELVNLSRTMARRLDTGRGMMISAADLELLAAIGVFDVIQQKASDYLREQAQQRRSLIEQRRAVADQAQTDSIVSRVSEAAISQPLATGTAPGRSSGAPDLDAEMKRARQR